MSQTPSIEEIMQRIRAQMPRPEQDPVTPAGRTESVSELMQRMRSKAAGVAPQPPGAPTPEAPEPVQFRLHSLGQLRTEIDVALEGSRETGQLNPRHSGPINQLIQIFKKVMRRSLTWYTRPLHKFEGGVLRALEQVRAILENHRDLLQKTATELNRQSAVTERNRVAFSGEIQQLQQMHLQAHEHLERELHQQVQQLHQKFGAAVHEEGTLRLAGLNDLTERIEGLHAELRALRASVTDRNRTRDRDLRRIFFQLEQERNPAPVYPAAQHGAAQSAVSNEANFDYFTFADRYLGQESDVRERHQAFLEYFRGREDVVDLGCGRGEFLELLRENNISARGTEFSTDQFLLCRDKGLHVVQQHALGFLESLLEESIGGIFSSHVLERLPAADQLRFISLAYRKTKPGSPVIIESLNAQAVHAMMHHFYQDPRNVRPVHPETLKFAMESVNFRDVELRFSTPVSRNHIPVLQLEEEVVGLERFNRAMQEVNNLLYGCQNFAVVGWK